MWERRKDSKYLTKILQKLILLFQLSRVLHSSSLASSSFNTNPFSVRKRIEAQKITNSESWRTFTLGLDMFLRQARVFFVSILWVDLRHGFPKLPLRSLNGWIWYQNWHLNERVKLLNNFQMKSYKCENWKNLLGLLVGGLNLPMWKMMSKFANWARVFSNLSIKSECELNPWRG